VHAIVQGAVFRIRGGSVEPEPVLRTAFTPASLALVVRIGAISAERYCQDLGVSAMLEAELAASASRRWPNCGPV
jgi:hypothetical protein